MKTAIIGTLAFTAILAVPAVSFAAVYQYVNLEGGLETVIANSPAQAITLPTDRNPHSGVVLVEPAVVTVPVSNGVSGTYVGTQVSSDTSGLSRGLVLAPDGTAALASNYENGQTPSVETGTWTQTGTGQLTLTLTGTATQTYSSAQVIVFTETGGALQAIQYDTSLYGTAGLTFTKVK